MNKITIIGTGSVGSTVAYTLTVMGLASEIVLIDVNNEKAVGEAMDIRQGTPFCSSVSIYAGSYQDAVGSNIVILTSGVARKPGQSRLDLAQTNVDITKKIIPEIVRYAPEAIYLIVSNPVDILTYTFVKHSGLPENQIIGSGTILDTSRLRARLSEYYAINQQNVHAYVMGEHGDSSFVPWSIANISNIPILGGSASLILSGNNSGVQWPEIDYKEVENYVKKSGGRVIERKGATYYAVSVSVCHICRCILGGINTTMTVSTMLHGEYGIDDVCLSLLNIIDDRGATGKMLLPLNDDEIKALHHSADTLKNLIKQMEI
ncbi:MAG: L-lactate dehydrogenase [Ruminococcaceae bacterium]|nr:L-lactate dehydrogenase [Oscillospiraceae bacterium]